MNLFNVINRVLPIEYREDKVPVLAQGVSFPDDDGSSYFCSISIETQLNTYAAYKAPLYAAASLYDGLAAAAVLGTPDGLIGLIVFKFPGETGVAGIKKGDRILISALCPPSRLLTEMEDNGKIFKMNKAVIARKNKEAAKYFSAKLDEDTSPGTASVLCDTCWKPSSNYPYGSSYRAGGNDEYKKDERLKKLSGFLSGKYEAPCIYTGSSVFSNELKVFVQPDPLMRLSESPYRVTIAGARTYDEAAVSELLGSQVELKDRRSWKSMLAEHNYKLPFMVSLRGGFNVSLHIEAHRDIRFGSDSLSKEVAQRICEELWSHREPVAVGLKGIVPDLVSRYKNGRLAFRRICKYSDAQLRNRTESVYGQESSLAESVLRCLEGKNNDWVILSDRDTLEKDLKRFLLVGALQ